MTTEPGPLERPAWFPQGRELEEWAGLVAHPRENAEILLERGLSSLPASAVEALRGSQIAQQASY